MAWLTRWLRIPANESQMSVALAMCAVAMSMMLWAILWQSEVISRQAEIIRWMRALRFGG